jgi:uncharacterized protein (DUF58 family)
MGAHVDLPSLVSLQFKARGFLFRSRQPIHSLLTGRHASRARGRGLDFDELRAYLPGDDIRTMDWRVTARAQKPYIRVFTEERDRPVVLAVDQRMNQFFGSRVSTKAVIAAEVASLGAWRVVRQGDRIGALVFNDSTVSEIKPQRSKAAVMRILQETVKQNNELSASSPVRRNPAMLNDVLKRVAGVGQHGLTIAVISDFDGADQETDNLLMRLSERNDVIAVFVYDPLTIDVPASGDLVISDGELQAEILFGNERMRKRLADDAHQRIQQILGWQRRYQIPVLPISTAEDSAQQVRRLLGQADAIRSQV